MSILTSLFTGVSGLTTNGQALSIIGDNISNSNTTAFKSSRAVFGDILSQAMGTSSSQIGRGTSLIASQQLFSQGTFETTSNPLDMAIDGNGFFMVKDSSGAQFYTRAGDFTLSKDGFIVNSEGMKVQGYLYDTSGKPTGAIGDINAATVNSSNPSATTTMSLEANLDSRTVAPTTAWSVSTATGPVAGSYNFNTSVTVYDSQGNAHPAGVYFSKIDANSIAGAAEAKANAAAAAAAYKATAAGTADPLTAAQVAAQLTSGTAAAATVTAAVNAYNAANATAIPLTGAADFTTSSLASSLSATATAAAAAAAAAYKATAAGTADPLTAAQVAAQLTAGTAPAATVTAAVNAYNAAHSTAVQLTSDSFSANPPYANTWEAHVVYNTSATGTNYQEASYPSGNTALFLQFDSSGKLTNVAPGVSGTPPANIGSGTTLTQSLGYDFKAWTGSTTVPTQTIGLNFGYQGTNTTQYGSESSMTFQNQDGWTSGSLSALNVDTNGILSGVFTNGQNRSISQVALASFTNPNGLTKMGKNIYAESFDSGQSAIGTPATSGRGAIQSSSLEMSNVDIADQFVQMISAQRGFEANTKVITTTDDLLSQVLAMKR